MQIRKMTLDDYDQVYALWLSCPGMGLNNLDDSREGIDRYLRRNPNTALSRLCPGIHGGKAYLIGKNRNLHGRGSRI